MRTTLIWAGLLIVSSFALAAPRLALLPEDATPETATRLDLLTAALAQGGAIDLVERSELRRVLDEQKLTAAGLVRAEQALALGKILRAEGILFLAREDAGKVLAARLVETRQGLIAGLWRYRPGADPIEKTVAQLAADVRTGVGKLASVGEKPLLVSVLRVGNATLDTGFAWIEDELPLLLGSLLTRDPRVLLLERRQLTQLLDETQTSAGGAAAFRTAGVLLDADIALKPGVAIDPDRLKRAVVMTVRLRTPQRQELASVSIEGTLGQTDRLLAGAATQLLARLRELKSIPATGDAGAEAKLFLELATRMGTTTAADAAHALNPTDEAALKKLVENLMRGPARTPGISTLDRDAALAWARNMNRAAELARDHLGTSLDQTFTSGVIMCHLMSSPPSQETKQLLLTHDPASVQSMQLRRDPEIRSFLRPVSEVVRLMLEKGWARGADQVLPGDVVMARCAFTDDDEGLAAYLEPVLLPVLDAKGNRSVRWRITIDGIFGALGDSACCTVPHWRGFLEKAVRRPEPEVGFCAHTLLVALDPDPIHVQEMGRLLPALFDGPEAWRDSNRPGDMVYMRLDGVAHRRQKESVACIGPALQKVLEQETDAGHLGILATSLNLLLDRPGWRPALIPAPAAVALLEKGLARAREVQAQMAAAPPDPMRKVKEDMLKRFIPSGTAVLEKLRAQVAMVPAATSVHLRPGADVLWRSGSPEWVAAFERLQLSRRHGGTGTPFLLVDGTSIWGWLLGPLLFQVDATTGRLLRLQIWQLTPQQTAAIAQTADKSDRLLGRGHLGLSREVWGTPWRMCRWGEYVCVSIWGLGVCLVPADAARQDAVRALGAKQGLSALDLVGIAPAGDTLYIASRLALMSATQGQDQVQLVVSLAGDTTASALPKGLVIRALVADRAGKNLYLLLREPWNEPPAGYRGPLWDSMIRRCSVWGLEKATGKWRLVRDGLSLNLGSSATTDPLRDPAKPVPRLPAVPGSDAEAVDYLVRWAEEFREVSMATLADGSVISADHQITGDNEYYIYRAPAPTAK